MCDRHRPETQAASHGAVPPAAVPGTAISGLGPNSLGAMGIGEGAAAKSGHRVPICATILGKSGPAPSRPRPEPTPDPDVPPILSINSQKGSKPPSPDGAVVIAETLEVGNPLRISVSCCRRRAFGVVAFFEHGIGEDRSSSVLCTRAVLRRPSVWSVMQHNEGCFRPADPPDSARHTGGPGTTPPIVVPPACRALSGGRAREPSMSQVLW